MSYQTRAYDSPGGDPVAVIVVTGTQDVSRMINLLAGSPANVEQLQTGQKLLKQVRSHNAGRAALKLLADHGGPDFTPDNTTIAIPRPEHDALTARIAELEAERQNVRRAMQAIAGAIGDDVRRYTDILDAQWPGWRAFADHRNASGS
jgi:hypothetical protein